ncbi:MAG: OadG family protein [Oligoflexia bacterium]|nr:OadG family protein [Oligoflexia bacterium]
MLSGIELAVLGLLVVFSGLLVITLLLYAATAFINKKFKIPGMQSGHGQDEYITSDVAVAIAAALYLYGIMHEDELQRLLTIQKVTVPFSPWANKNINEVISRNDAVYRRRWK